MLKSKGVYPPWKCIFDKALALAACVLLIPFFIIFFVLVSLDTQSNGIYRQKRVGQFGKIFTMYKFKSIQSSTQRISKLGSFMRKTKIDELPQVFNILIGDMSFVGPRPDVPGYYDCLQGSDREVLLLKPGLTSEASIKYRNEDKLLSQSDNPVILNDKILFPDKVVMNLNYVQKVSLKNDIRIIIRTISSIFAK